eukprot:5940695-Prymnesium_polylepis.1
MLCDCRPLKTAMSFISRRALCAHLVGARGWRCSQLHHGTRPGGTFGFAEKLKDAGRFTSQRVIEKPKNVKVVVLRALATM